MSPLHAIPVAPPRADRRLASPLPLADEPVAWPSEASEPAAEVRVLADEGVQADPSPAQQTLAARSTFDSAAADRALMSLAKLLAEHGPLVGRADAAREEAERLGAQALRVLTTEEEEVAIAAFYAGVADFMVHWADGGQGLFLGLRSAYLWGLLSAGVRENKSWFTRRACLNEDDARFVAIRARARRRWP